MTRPEVFRTCRSASAVSLSSWPLISLRTWEWIFVLSARLGLCGATPLGDCSMAPMWANSFALVLAFLRDAP
eukprot:4407386-Heterocapsa_arctica.AAC.1